MTREPVRYLALTVAWSWFCWIPAALSGQEQTELPTLFLAVGGAAPAIVALSLLAERPADARRDIWRRVFDWRRISSRW